MYQGSSIGAVLIILLLLTISVANVLFLFITWPEARVVSEESGFVRLDVATFSNYMVKFNKTYSGHEFQRRLQNFKASLAEISRLNALEGATVFGLTQFSDMSAEELFITKTTKNVGDHCTIRNEDCDAAPYTEEYWDDMPIPNKFDWRKKGYVTPVLEQRACLGCWAFSIVGVMETMAAKSNISRMPLSIQELLDCSTYNNGCFGGNVGIALEFICRKKLGIVSEAKYPLTLKHRNCNVPLGTAITLKHYKYHCNMDEDDILRTIVYHGPVTTIVNAAPWYNYIGGIIRRACVRNENSYQHAVQIVGYDKSGAIPYYIVKNSWGTIFGDDGYVKVAIYENVCGIAEEIGEFDVKKIVYN